MLSIQIPTIIGREKIFKELLREFETQSAPYGDAIEIIYLQDDREMSIGTKRNILYRKSTKEYSLQWDDDDWIHPRGIELIMDKLKDKPDCVTYDWLCYFDPVIEVRSFNIKYPAVELNVDKYNRVGPPSPKCVVKTEIARNIVLPDIRYGEDGHFEKEIGKYINNSAHIDEYIYFYLDRSKEGRGPERYNLPKNFIF